MRASLGAWVGVLGAGLLTAQLAAAPSAADRPIAQLAAAPSAADRPVAQRIVSMAPSLTSILMALGARDQLVGIDEYGSRRHPELASLPVVGGLYDPSLEAVVGLRPDLVVLVPSAEQRSFRERLEGLGVPVLPLDPRSLEEVLGVIETLGRHTGHEQAALVRVAAIRAAKQQVEAAVRGRPVVRAVLVLQRDPLFLAGQGTFIHDMMESAGAENLASSLGGSYPRVAREWLLAQAPELLLDSAPDAESAAVFWARWPSIPAVGAGRVVAFPQGHVTLPGPDLDRALFALVRAIHPGALPGEADERTHSQEKDQGTQPFASGTAP